MFYQCAKKEWQKGNISVGLSADDMDNQVYLDAKGMTQFVLTFLNASEKHRLAVLSKELVRQHVMCANKPN